MGVVYLLNEKNEITALLDGKRLNKKNTYRSCYLLAKHFKLLGYDAIRTREKIFSWANGYGVYLKDDLNSIIQRAFNDKKEILDNVEIKISKEDIEEIKRRFDKYNTRLTAFALLCFAKKHADRNGIFYISRVGLSNWIGIKQSNLSNRHIKELVDFGYIEKLSVNDIRFIKRKNLHISKVLMLKMKVDFKNEGEHLIQDYDFRQECENLFSIYDT